MVFCMVHIFLPEVVEINVEIAVDLFVVVCARFTSLLFHRQYSLSVFTLDCDHGIPNFHAVMCKAVSAEIRLVDLSGSNFHGHGFDGNPNFHRLRELFTGMFLAIH